MIRVGSSSSGISAQLNSFHSTATQTSGFYTNATGGIIVPPEEEELTTYVGLPSPVPPIPTSLDGYNLCVYRSLGALPVTVTAGYLSIDRVSGGFNVVKSSGYSSNVTFNLPAGDYSIATNLPIGGSTYIRWMDQGQNGITYTWYRSNSGTPVRDILAIGPGLMLDTTTAPDHVRGSEGSTAFDVVTFTYDSTNLSIRQERDFSGVSYFLEFNGTYAAWSGSGLGNGSFRIMFFHQKPGWKNV